SQLAGEGPPAARRIAARSADAPQRREIRRSLRVNVTFERAKTWIVTLTPLGGVKVTILRDGSSSVTLTLSPPRPPRPWPVPADAPAVPVARAARRIRRANRLPSSRINGG